jgi:hypothetical protein
MPRRKSVSKAPVIRTPPNGELVTVLDDTYLDTLGRKLRAIGGRAKKNKGK